jgi:hypothetical protein
MMPDWQRAYMIVFGFEDGWEVRAVDSLPTLLTKSKAILSTYDFALGSSMMSPCIAAFPAHKGSTIGLTTSSASGSSNKGDKL